jgi:hypothetical protein
MEALIARHPKIVGVIAQNDDVADGCIAALRAAGIRPGSDVFLSGADGTTHGAEAIKQGTLLATSANVPAYMGGLLATRLYDVLHGWKPRAAERLMSWRSITMTKSNVDAYIARYVKNGGTVPAGCRSRVGRNSKAVGLDLPGGIREIAGKRRSKSRPRGICEPLQDKVLRSFAAEASLIATNVPAGRRDRHRRGARGG